MSSFLGLPALDKDTLNTYAARFKLPFLVTGKLDGSQVLNPGHLECVDHARFQDYVAEGKFTTLFEDLYRQMVEMKRRETVALTLADCRCISMTCDVSGFSEEERQMLGHLVEVRDRVDRLFMKQKGSYKYLEGIEEGRNEDPLSHRLFWRNLGPWSGTSRAQGNPFANAVSSLPVQHPGVYPSDIEFGADFDAVKKAREELAHPWTVLVRDDTGDLEAVRYHRYFQPDMQEIAEELDLAARCIEAKSDERALHDYLVAAAEAFRTGDWDAADVKWVAMNRTNSKFALRVAPDETYWDPQNNKAGFEFWLALIDQDGAAFSELVAPCAQDMENEFHKLVPHYLPRTVAFDMPDSIEMILVGGDHRHESGAVIGQKLPNFSDQHSRMVVMTNFHSDPDLQRLAQERAALMLVSEQAANYKPDPRISSMNTLLHEMTHSFGVRAENYQVLDGVTGEATEVSTKVALGGASSQVMEELKAQTGALYWPGWLKERGILDQETCEKLYTDAILWAFGHISNGMKLANGAPRTYSQLAGIQLRHLLKKGALTLEEGKFHIHHEKMHAAVEDLFREVIQVQVYGDADRANEWREDVAEGPGREAIQQSRVQELYAKFPKSSYELSLTGL